MADATPPTWWLKKAMPSSMVNQRDPNIIPTSADVGGTVESHSRPITAPNTSVTDGPGGGRMKARIASERLK